MTDRELMRQGLEALTGDLSNPEWDDLITALQERLAQPEQEPVCDKDPQGCWNVRCQLGKVCKNTPPRREWVGLAEDEVAQAMYRADAIFTGPMQFKFAKEIEAKLKEKNT